MNESQTQNQTAAASSIFSKNSKKSVDSDSLVYLADFEAEALELLENEGKYIGVSTGYSSIDERLGSFLPGELFVLGGDTGHGKSIFAMNVAQNVYQQTQKPVLYVNMELTRAQAVQRFYNLSGKTHDYKGILTQVSTDLHYKDIDKLMKEAKEKDVSLVIIDHLHFFNDSIGDNAASALTRVVKHFKQAAVTHELPVMLLSHVTPSTDSTGKVNRPNGHDLRGSRSIEQLSDIVGFVYRDVNKPEVVEFYITKQRSRKLISSVTELTQKDWRLHDYNWLPEG